MTSKREVLEELSIGSRVAEDETDQLAAYFVETDQWRKVSAGDVDVIFGSKGSGKSAIYSTLINRTNEIRSAEGEPTLYSSRTPQSRLRK